MAPASAERPPCFEVLRYDLSPCCSIRAAAVLRSCQRRGTTAVRAHPLVQWHAQSQDAGAVLRYHKDPVTPREGSFRGRHLGVADALDKLQHLALVTRQRQALRHGPHRQRHQHDCGPSPNAHHAAHTSPITNTRPPATSAHERVFCVFQFQKSRRRIFLSRR